MSKKPHHHTQRVILITGCSSGFGLLAAARLSAKGHFVYATMRDLSKQEALLDEVSKRGGQVLVRLLDVTRVETIKEVVDEIYHHHKHVDVVINNAGYGLGGFFEDLSQDEIRQQMEVNFFGVQHVCRQVIPLMRERQQGKIINISSIAGLTGTPSLGAYNASKWALEGFSESLYHELAMFGIKVVLVEPGSYPTKIFKDNARYAKNFDNPHSPYFSFSQRLRAYVNTYIQSSTKDPEYVAALIEKIIDEQNPRLRYISDLSSWFRVMGARVLPPAIYTYIFRKAMYGQRSNTV